MFDGTARPLDVEAADHSGLEISSSTPGFLQRLRNFGRAALPRSWRRDATGFSKLVNEDDGGNAAPTVSRPTGLWIPEETASSFSKLFFCYVDGILRLGYSKPLLQEDVWDLAARDQSKPVSADFSSVFESDPHRGSVLRSMWQYKSRPFLQAGVLKLIHDMIMFTGPLCLQYLLKALQDGRPFWIGLSLALGLVVSGVVETLLINTYFHWLFRVSLHLKVSLIDMLFSKSLRISSGVKGRYGVGAITNLQSNDAAKLYNLAQYLHMLWSGPLQILVVMGMLVRVLHWLPAACGLASTIALIPASIFTGRKLAAVRKQLMLQTDARIKLCSEVVTGIKAIKLYAWEEPYVKRIAILRDKELREIRRAAFWGILNSLIFFGGPIIISLTSFAVFSGMGYPLTADVAFAALALFNLLRFPVLMFPNQIMNIINGKVALQRIQKFMEEEEMEQPKLNPRAKPHHAAVKVTDGSFAWEREGEPFLKDVNLEVLEGQLLMIVGEVGGGKSSLLYSLLGEMHVCSGDASVSGTVAYTAQDPWIQNATLRENILMDHEFEEDKYARVLDACALRTDLEQLPAGDMSEIGEKGINLSGGQRHRVALARACYADSDVVLLDDPLSAVDAHVGKQLWSDCVCGMLAPRTRILVTHQTQFLPFADLIAVVQGGRISHLGTFEALESEVDFHAFEIPEEADTTEDPEKAPKSPDGLRTATPPVDTRSVSGALRADEQEREAPASRSAETETHDDSDRPSSSGQSEEFLISAGSPKEGLIEGLETDAVHLASVLSADLEDVTDKGLFSGLDKKEDVILTVEERETHEQIALLPRKAAAEQQGKIVKVEERATGSVEKSVYMAYIKAWGPFLLPLAVLAAAISERLAAIGQNYWLKVWSDATAVSQKTSTPTDTPFYMSIYFVLGVGTLALLVVRATAVIFGTINASRRLHYDLLHKVVRMPMSFFDSQPTGRLLNRFSRDTEALDTSLTQTVSSVLSCVVSVTGAMLVVIAVTPAVLAAVIPLSIAYRYVQRFYIATSRELKRLDSLAMSPIFGHFSESIAGLLTLRAFRRQVSSREQNQAKLDRSNRVYWVIQNVNRWLSVRLELLGIGIVFTTAIIVTIFPTNPGLAGLALTSALNLTGLMNWMVRMTAELEVNMNSVERMVEYLPLESEAAAVVEDNRPPEDWPLEGAIQVESLVVRYRRELQPVIHGLSFATRAREKVGVAGRTGCGKSTLMMALYRIVEPAGGRILIDGIDVSKIGLTDLRSRLALVPQEPVIFSGTVRSNLDPFGQAGDDSAMWSALRQAGLADMVEGLQGGLEASLTEGGGNLSTGQRQLLCMARALLRKARILVMDEATSNVDPGTDSLIQATIRSAFAECMTLTIAHRLNTILDSDRVLVLEAGRLLEFDSPRNLMKDPASAFSKLAAESKGSRSTAAGSRSGSLANLASKRSWT